MLTKTRIAGLIASGIGLAVVAVSLPAMAKRVDAYHKATPPPRFHFEKIPVREFMVYGKQATIRDVAPEGLPDRAEQLGDDVSFLEITYADSVVLAPVRRPAILDMTLLDHAYPEWVSVVAVRNVRGREVPTQDVPPDHMTVVTRIVPTGFDSDWAKSRRGEWTFAFYELTPDGQIERSLWRFPRSERGEKSLAARADEDAYASVPVMDERSWRFQTALHAIPKLKAPKYRFRNDAVTGAMGWTLPAAAFGGLVFTLGAVFVFAPKRRERQATPTPVTS